MTRKQKKAIRGQLSDFAQGRLDPRDALLVLDEVENDRDLSAELNVHVELLNLSKSDAAQEFRPLPRLAFAPGLKPAPAESWWAGILRGRRLLVPAGIALGLVVAGVVLVAVFSNSVNPYGALADLGDPAASFRMRGVSDADLADASTLFIQGDAGEAASRFERFLRMYPSSEWVPWVEYAAGLSRLSNARSTFLGIGVRYDAGEVRRGLEHLGRVVEYSASPELAEDALWYRAKGSLMIGDARSAESDLARILTFQGGRQQGARQLLSDLHLRQN